MPNIPSDVCHVIIGGLVVAIGVLARFVASQRTENHDLQEHLNKTNESILKMMSRRRSG